MAAKPELGFTENEVELSPAELEEKVRPLFGEYLDAISTSPLFREVLANRWKRSWDWKIETLVEIETENFHYFISRRRGNHQSLWLTKYIFKEGEIVLVEDVTLTIKGREPGRVNVQYSSEVQPITGNRDKIIILTRSLSAVEQAKAFLQRMKTDLLTPQQI